jgi:hypothetical protein
MRKLLPALILMLWPHMTTVASAQCAGKESISSAFERSTYVFSGRVVLLDQITSTIQVDKMWKGEERSEIVMRTGTLVTAGGFMTISERVEYAIGQQYVIYASGSLDKLTAPGCSHSGLLSDAEIAALDAIAPRRKIGTEIHRCTGTAAATAGEIRVAVSSSSEVPKPGARVTLDGSSRHDGARTDNSGHALFTGLPPGEYKVTADLEGHTPKQATVTVPEKACMDAALFLSPQ